MNAYELYNEMIKHYQGWKRNNVSSHYGEFISAALALCALGKENPFEMNEAVEAKEEVKKEIKEEKPEEVKQVQEQRKPDLHNQFRKF